MRIRQLLTAVALTTSGLVATVGFASAGDAATKVPLCLPAHIKLSVGVVQGAAGTIFYPVIFTNTGATCTIWGVPSVRPGNLAASGKLTYIGPLARNTSMGEMPVLHTLKKGQSVSVDIGVLETGNYTASTCVAKKAGGLYVTLGDFAHGFVSISHLSVCSRATNISTRLVAPGRNG